MEHCEMAEIRLDRCHLTMEQIGICFSSDVPLVATCRVSEMMASDDSLNEISASLKCEKRLVAAIESGAMFVDVEIDAPKSMTKRVRDAARENGTIFIRSYHNFCGTDSFDHLRNIVGKCSYHGADIVKIVTAATCDEDVNTVMRLYEESEHKGLIAFCMGENASMSRIECLAKGAPFTYAALSEREVAAPGQMTEEQMLESVYKGFRFIGNAADDDTPLRMPASKSFAQRAVIAAALADGESHLDCFTSCADSDAAIAVAEALGAKVSVEDMALYGYKKLSIRGISCSPASVGINALNVGESGLLTRLMIPLTAAVASGDVVLTGEKTLLERPMKGAKEMMSHIGVRIENTDCLAEDESRTPADNEDCRVPLKVVGTLESGRYEISGKYGSQLISGLLMALPLCEKNSQIIVNEPKSIPYMFITLDVLKKFGIKVANEMSGNRDFFESGGDWSLCTDMTFKVRGNQRYRAADFSIEGDWSAAASFLVAGAVFGKVALSGLDTSSLQADLSIIDILTDAGASLSQLEGKEGTVIVQRAPLSAFETDASNCPDLFPIISVLAAFCDGTSRIAGVDRLKHKESDRGEAIVEMFLKMGVEARIEGNELVVRGYSLANRCLCGNLLKGGEYTSHHDHRMVMALKVAGLGADSPVVIDDEDCVGKSFPGFAAMFSELIK